MKILAFDSTAVSASVAVCENEHLLALTTLNAGLTHSETLLPLIDELLGHTGVKTGDIELFACSTGPGSFTSVRIGAATVKGLAFGRNVPCIGVTTLEALAHNLSCCNGIICPVMNARRGQVYNALFECRDGRLTRLCPDRAISVEGLEAELENLLSINAMPVYLCGDGTSMTRDMLVGIRPAYVPEFLIWQNAYSVAQCALGLYRSGIRTTDAELSPTYLRMPQAERERLEREKSSNGV